ncbi:MAG: HD domain-containing protein [Candidatus Promineifilaceae bacterium]
MTHHLVDKAIAIAVQGHAGQTDKAGRPYILHPLHLMMQMNSNEEMITAVLHDVVEDTNITLDDLAKEGFPPEVLEALSLLTHDDGTPYDDYVARLKHHPLARRVKIADLEHNMDVRRLNTMGEKDLQRLQKYQHAWRFLQEP